jgi:hypothetical protein
MVEAGSDRGISGTEDPTPNTQHPTPEHRTPDTSLQRLERKLVSAFACGASAVAEWFWDQGDGSSGLRRVDRSQKPEYGVIPEFRNFLKELRRWYVSRSPEDVCVVVPQTMLLAHPERGLRAVRAAMRVMEYRCGMPVRTVGEYGLAGIGKPRMIVIPSVDAFSEKSWEGILKAVNGGATLLVTGSFTRDEHGVHTDRLGRLGINVHVTEAAEVERLIVFGIEQELTFDMPGIEKGVVAGTTGQIKTQSLGEGFLIYAPLPFELSTRIEPVAALYRYALSQAAMEPPCVVSPADLRIFARPLYFAKAVLYSLMSSVDEDRDITLADSHTGHSYEVSLPERGSALFIVSRNNGEIIATFGTPCVLHNPFAEADGG